MDWFPCHRPYRLVVYKKVILHIQINIYEFIYLFIGEFSISLYPGIFNILKIMTTTHNDIVCISFNSKSAHSNPPIYIYMQKDDSLSFPMVLGSGGRGLSLLNEICVGAKWLRSWFLWSFNVIWRLCSMWFEISVHNNSCVFFFDSKNYLMLWQAVISWSFYCDEIWFTEVYRNLPQLSNILRELMVHSTNVLTYGLSTNNKKKRFSEAHSFHNSENYEYQ